MVVSWMSLVNRHDQRPMNRSGAPEGSGRVLLRRFARVFPFLLIPLYAIPALAGPPFQTDDPEPVPWHHYEAYLFSTADRSSGSTAWILPAFEFNVGAAPNLQLHAIIPAAYVTSDDAYGIGDVELGAKYRFLRETDRHPEVGVFPLVEVPTGNSRLGLGNGQVWARLPVWIQKTHGPWTTYGGVGYQINHAPGMKDSLFAGWLVQRQATRRLALGAEVYYQGAQASGARQTTFLDAGGYYNFSNQLSLLFMLGHTVRGEQHTVGYLGLYYTWGRK
jgi:hypothetical protein